VIEHRIVIAEIGLSGPENDKVLIRGTAEAVTRCRAAAFIYETRGFWDDDAVPVGAVIPADVARELIAEGRLSRPPLAGITVLARDARPSLSGGEATGGPPRGP